MKNEISCNSRGAPVVTAVYEQVTIFMEQQDMFEVVFRELLPAVGSERGLLRIASSHKTAYCYGYDVDRGLHLWEPGGAGDCPAFMSEIIDNLSGYSADIENEGWCTVSNTACAAIKIDGRSRGYIAVALNPAAPADTHVVDILRAVGRQVAVFMEKKTFCEKREHAQKMSLTRSILSVLSHNMKNPLSGISGFVQLIAQKTDDQSIKTYCGIVLDSLIQLEDVNSEILSIVNNQPLLLHLSEVSLLALLKELQSRLEGIYRHEGVEIVVADRGDVVIQADRTRLIKALGNIVKNAKEAICGGGGTIRISLDKNDISALVEVADTGSGIPFRIRNKVCDPFYAFGKENASGLGLTIAKRIIDEHHGSLSFSSVSGKGSVFAVQLPFAQKEDRR